MWVPHTKRKNFENIDYVTPQRANGKVAWMPERFFFFFSARNMFLSAQEPALWNDGRNENQTES